MSASSLTFNFQNMPKSKKASTKRGREEEITPDDLLRRYAAMKRFLEDDWGRLGLKLPAARKPDDVRSVLKLVPGVQWCPAFRDFPTGCLLRDGNIQATWRQVRATRYKWEEARRVENQLSRESQTAHQSLQPLKNAFESVRKGRKESELPDHERTELQTIAKQLRIEEMTNRAHELRELLQVAQVKRESLEHQLSTEEAWLARNEVIAFVRDRKRRYSKTPANFAKAMAGLPFYDWLYSVRKCQSIPELESVSKTYLFQVFEMVQKIVRRTRSANLRKIESKLKSELLTEAAPILTSYISPLWFYMTLAFADCRGKKIRRAHIPYKVMERFLEHRYSPDQVKGELAKLHQLLPSDL
jgi:hypothetical protein